jgi:hypothetical protein
LDSLRLEVAASRGLGPRAVAFLDAETVEAIEAQADQLVAVLGTTDRQRPEQEPAQVDPITLALQAKARRKHELVQSIIGRPQQARDERGRFLPRGSGFDGGARPALPVRSDPIVEHDRIVGQLAHLRRVYGGA